MINEELSPREESTTSDDNFITPVSSSGDLMILSPKRDAESWITKRDMTDDLLTGTEFDSICDVTMKEVIGSDDLFMDPGSLDFLTNCTDSNRKMPCIDKGKDSLFVKFDPLYSQRRDAYNEEILKESSSDTTSTDFGYETGSANSMSEQAAPPKRSISAGPTLLNGAKDKPTQIVSPAVKSDIPSNESLGRTAPLVRSVSEIMPPAKVPIERLVNYAVFSPPPQPAPRNSGYDHYYTHRTDQLQSLKTILQRQEQDLVALNQENRDLKYTIQDLEKNMLRQKDDMELKMKKICDENANLLERESLLSQQVRDKVQSNKQMCVVIEEYEKTISSLIGEQQRGNAESREALESLQQERDQAIEHLGSMESSFNDLLTKYERCKVVILEFKERERSYDKKISEYQDGIEKYEELYTKLKQVTSETLSKANETLDNLKKSHCTEITKLNATIKKQEIQISSLQESLVQKDRDNKELTAICDELINKVG